MKREQANQTSDESPYLTLATLRQEAITCLWATQADLRILQKHLADHAVEQPSPLDDFIKDLQSLEEIVNALCDLALDIVNRS